MKVTLINHSSLLFELNKGKNVFLTDFGTSKSLLKLASKRLPYNPVYLAGLSYQKISI